MRLRLFVSGALFVSNFEDNDNLAPLDTPQNACL